MNIAHPFRYASAAATLIGSAFAAAGVSAPAAAADQFANNGPIEIRACSLVYAPSPQQVYALGYSDVAGVEIDYVNHADVAAADVTFRVGSESGGTLLADHGSFAPGVLIRRVFWTGPNSDASSCSVASARLQGGTAFDPSASAPGANR